MTNILSIFNYLTPDVYIILGLIFLLCFVVYKHSKAVARCREQEELIINLIPEKNRDLPPSPVKVFNPEEIREFIKVSFPYTYLNTKGNTTPLKLSKNAKDTIEKCISTGITAKINSELLNN